MTEQASLEHQLEEIGTQLSWVRDYLLPRTPEGPHRRARAGARRTGILGRPAARGAGFGRARTAHETAGTLRTPLARLRGRARALCHGRRDGRRDRRLDRAASARAQSPPGGRALYG